MGLQTLMVRYSPALKKDRGGRPFSTEEGGPLCRKRKHTKRDGAKYRDGDV